MLIPQFTQILDAKLGQIKADLKQELIMTVEAMKAPQKEEINADMGSKVTNRLQNQSPKVSSTKFIYGMYGIKS